MSSSMESVRVVIFGTEYSIKADVDIETTRQVARFVNSKMAEIHENSASRDNVKIAVLSALNIAGELLDLRQKQKIGVKKADELTDRVAQIVKKIDDALQRA
jgi:cell division protein ZapA